MSAGFLHPSSAPASTPIIVLAESKSPTAFRTISEVAGDLQVPQHVLRFWESKFQQIKPLKRGGGRRYYRPEDVKVIHDIKDLLYNQGFTIRGVQKLLRESSATLSAARAKVAEPQLPITIPALASPRHAETVAHAHPVSSLAPDKRRDIEGLLSELKAMRKLLQQTGI